MLENIVRAELNRRILEQMPIADRAELVERIRQRVIDPYTAADELLKGIYR